MTTTNDTAVPQDDARTRVFERIDQILDACDAAELTDEQAVALMPAVLAHIEAQQAQAPKQLPPDERDLADRVKDADDLQCVYANNSNERRLPGVAGALYDAGNHLICSDDAMHQRLGYVMSLDALLASPASLLASVRTLRQSLAASDPEIARMYSGSAIDQPVPLAVVCQINGEDFRLEPDGTMYGFGRDLSREEVFNLLAFFRMPGVAALVDRLEVEHQTQIERDGRLSSIRR